MHIFIHIYTYIHTYIHTHIPEKGGIRGVERRVGEAVRFGVHIDRYTLVKAVLPPHDPPCLSICIYIYNIIYIYI